MREMTEWYPRSIKPLADRPGWYERHYKHEDTIYRDWWDGVRWRYWPETGRSIPQSIPWRGLTAPDEEGVE